MILLRVARECFRANILYCSKSSIPNECLGDRGHRLDDLECYRSQSDGPIWPDQMWPIFSLDSNHIWMGLVDVQKETGDYTSQMEKADTILRIKIYLIQSITRFCVLCYAREGTERSEENVSLTRLPANGSQCRIEQYKWHPFSIKNVHFHLQREVFICLISLTPYVAQLFNCVCSRKWQQFRITVKICHFRMSFRELRFQVNFKANLPRHCDFRPSLCFE